MKKAKTNLGANTGLNKKFVKVKTARRRSNASTRWLQRQLNDPYVSEAKRLGYRSRAAFKLIELHERFNLISTGDNVIDLGAAPGGWTQIAIMLNKAKGQVIGLDILPMDTIAEAITIQKDFTEDDAPQMLKDLMNGEANVVMSDMAANTTGHQQTDHLRIMMLVEMAFYFAKDVLAEGGTFIAKVFQGGAEGELLNEVKQCFSSVKHWKPPASRKGSPETYLIAQGFKKQQEN